MSDTPQGEGWWVASDGRYYPPEQHPDYVAPSRLPAVVPPAPTPEVVDRFPPAVEDPPLPEIEGTIWTGDRNGMTQRARYTVTHDRLIYESGRLSTKSEQFPLVSIKDIDIKQSMVQKTRGWGDVIVHFDHEMTDRPSFTVESVVEFRQLRDLLDRQSKELRIAAHHRANTQTINYAAGLPPTVSPTGQAAPPSAPEPSLAPTLIASELKSLAELRDAGVLTDEEFRAQKAKLLGQ
jgi:hypothetical protein